MINYRTSTTDFKRFIDRDSLGRPTPPKVVESSFAFHCGCGLTTHGFTTRRGAQRAAREHRQGCPGGMTPLPRNARAARPARST